MTKTSRSDIDVLKTLADIGVSKATAARVLSRAPQWVDHWSDKTGIGFRKFHAPTHPWQTELALARLHRTMTRLNGFAKGADNQLLSAGTVGL